MEFENVVQYLDTGIRPFLCKSFLPCLISWFCYGKYMATVHSTYFQPNIIVHLVLLQIRVQIKVCNFSHHFPWLWLVQENESFPESTTNNDLLELSIYYGFAKNTVYNSTPLQEISMKSIN